MKSETDTTQQKERQSKFVGGGTVLLFHLLFLLFFSTTGFHTLNLHPPDQGILIEFLPDPMYVNPRSIPGQLPRASNPDPDVDARLVQQALQTEVVEGQERTQQSTLGESGDVEVHEPPPPKPIDQRALYRSRDTGDTLAEQNSRVTSQTMQAGHPDGNTREGNPEGAPSAALPGRDVLGSLPLPEYTAANIGGTVVVRILVDQYGNVTNANVTQTGTTVQSNTLWESAVKAALKAKFNVSSAAPVVQEGTISYEFILK